jgi:hypothetical protein
MKPDYVVAVPSHRRSELFASKTLAYLRTTDVQLSRVQVFLSDTSDVAAYKKAAPKVKLVVPTTPITNVRDKFNAIHAAYPAGTRVFVMEDDVELVTGKPGKNGLTALTALDAMVRAGFAATPVGLWGVAPHANAFYFSGKVTHTLKLAVAHAFGFTATGDPALAVRQPSKTDYERTCRYFAQYGMVGRMDMVGVRTNSYTQPGGMQADHTREARAELERVSCEYLVRRFPHMLEHNHTKPSMFAELRFKRCTLPLEQLLAMEFQARAAEGG